MAWCGAPQTSNRCSRQRVLWISIYATNHHRSLGATRTRSPLRVRTGDRNGLPLTFSTRSWQCFASSRAMLLRPRARVPCSKGCVCCVFVDCLQLANSSRKLCLSLGARYTYTHARAAIRCCVAGRQASKQYSSTVGSARRLELQPKDQRDARRRHLIHARFLFSQTFTARSLAASCDDTRANRHTHGRRYSDSATGSRNWGWHSSVPPLVTTSTIMQISFFCELRAASIGSDGDGQQTQTLLGVSAPSMCHPGRRKSCASVPHPLAAEDGGAAPMGQHQRARSKQTNDMYLDGVVVAGAWSLVSMLRFASSSICNATASTILAPKYSIHFSYPMLTRHSSPRSPQRSSEYPQATTTSATLLQHTQRVRALARLNGTARLPSDKPLSPLLASASLRDQLAWKQMNERCQKTSAYLLLLSQRCTISIEHVPFVHPDAR